MRAFIIDDDASIRRMLSRCLPLWGWEAVEQPSVAAATAAFAEKRPELALCDVDLPDGDGVALALTFRKADAGLRLVLMSGNPENLERARLNGLTACLQKPFELAELRALIEDEAMTRARFRRASSG